MATPIAELTAEVVGIVGSSIDRSVGVVTYSPRSDRFGTIEGELELPDEDIALLLDRLGTQGFPGGDLTQETPRSEV
jgi:hypothetical protein